MVHCDNVVGMLNLLLPLIMVTHVFNDIAILVYDIDQPLAGVILVILYFTARAACTAHTYQWLISITGHLGGIGIKAQLIDLCRTGYHNSSPGWGNNRMLKIGIAVEGIALFHSTAAADRLRAIFAPVGNDIGLRGIQPATGNITRSQKISF